MSKVLRICAALLAFTVTALAQDYKAGGLQISHTWARATPKGAPVGGGYFTITNNGKEADRLVGGSSPVAKKVEVHEMSMDKGVMKMRELSSGLEIEPGKTLTLKPGGLHVMFVGLNQPLKQGDKVTATLEFAKAGKVQVEFTVEGMGATQDGNAGPPMHGMGH